jgi:hypothetical protein
MNSMEPFFCQKMFPVTRMRSEDQCKVSKVNGNYVYNARTRKNIKNLTENNLLEQLSLYIHINSLYILLPGIYIGRHIPVKLENN